MLMALFEEAQYLCKPLYFALTAFSEGACPSALAGAAALRPRPYAS